MKKKYTILALAGIALLKGCGTQASAQSVPQTFRIGITIDDSNPEQGAVYQDFIDQLSAFIEMPVEVIKDVTYLIAIEAMRAGHLDMMMASAFNYVIARNVVDVALIASLPLGGQGNYTVFITQYDSDIDSLADFEGRSFAFVDAASTSGYIFPKYYLVTQLGLDPNQLLNSGYFFSTAVFSGSHQSSLMGTYFGDFDGAGVVAMILYNMIDTGTLDSNSIRIIDRTDPFPDITFIARRELGDELLSQIREFYVNFDDPNYFYHAWGNENIRFTEPDHEAFTRIISLVETLGIQP